VLNGQQVSQAALVLRASGGALYVSRADLESWRLQIPVSPPLSHDGEDYLPLAAFRGLQYRLDEPSQALIMSALPNAFIPIAIRGTRTAFATPRPSPPGAFLNYELTATRSGGELTESALLEPSVFGRWGSWQ